MKMAAVITILFLSLACSAAAQDQDANHESMLVQAGLIWGLPQGGLTDNISREPLGVSFLTGGRVPGLPLFLGTDIGLMSHGLQERIDLYSLEEVPVQALTSSVSNTIFMVHLLARLQLEYGPVQPYLEMLRGMKYFTTRNTLRGDPVVFPDGFNAASRVFDHALSYGIGAGVNIPLYRGDFGIDRRPGTASLTFSARYLPGTDADVARETFFDEEAELFRFDVVRSSTTLLIPQFGVRVDI
ncbi:MAG: hypothetical protein WDZ53_02335 [Balneolales bacterium]